MRKVFEVRKALFSLNNRPTDHKRLERKFVQHAPLNLSDNLHPHTLFKCELVISMKLMFSVKRALSRKQKERKETGKNQKRY